MPQRGTTMTRFSELAARHHAVRGWRDRLCELRAARRPLRPGWRRGDHPLGTTGESRPSTRPRARRWSPMPIKHCLWRQGLIRSAECRLPLTQVSAALDASSTARLEVPHARPRSDRGRLCRRRRRALAHTSGYGRGARGRHVPGVSVAADVRGQTSSAPERPGHRKALGGGERRATGSGSLCGAS